jgi:broad specificity phosphatase PhoE
MGADNMRRIRCGITCGLIALALIELRLSLATAQNTGPAIVWLVRHADRADDSPDSPLKNPDGFQRAQDLKTCLNAKGVTAIITTDKKRTIQTAEPIAGKEGITPVMVPIVDTAEGAKQNIDTVAAKVRATQGKVLVVGHSNTVAGIIKELGGPGGLGDITVFHRLFILDFSKGKAAFDEMKYGVAPKVSKKKQC